MASVVEVLALVVRYGNFLIEHVEPGHDEDDGDDRKDDDGAAPVRLLHRAQPASSAASSAHLP